MMMQSGGYNMNVISVLNDNLNATIERCNRYSTKEGNFDILCRRYKNIDELKAFFDSNIDINEQGEGGDTFLHYCVKYGHAKLVEHLCKWGADINIKNDEGKRAVDLAWERPDCPWPYNNLLGVILSNSQPKEKVV
jgi:hypothetical protein